MANMSNQTDIASKVRDSNEERVQSSALPASSSKISVAAPMATDFSESC